MLFARAIRNLTVGRSQLHRSLLNWNSTRCHHQSLIRSWSHEARAVQRLLNKSNVSSVELARICGVRYIHTTNSRCQDNDGDKDQKKNDDERDRMLSAFKTAVGFFIVPLFLLYMFNGASRRERENMTNLDNNNRSRPPGEDYINKSFMYL